MSTIWRQMKTNPFHVLCWHWFQSPGSQVHWKRTGQEYERSVRSSHHGGSIWNRNRPNRMRQKITLACLGLSLNVGSKRLHKYTKAAVHCLWNLPSSSFEFCKGLSSDHNALMGVASGGSWVVIQCPIDMLCVGVIFHPSNLLRRTGVWSKLLPLKKGFTSSSATSRRRIHRRLDSGKTLNTVKAHCRKIWRSTQSLNRRCKILWNGSKVVLWTLNVTPG